MKKFLYLGVLALAACAGTQAPPPEFYRLSLDLPTDATPRAGPSSEVWQLVGPIRLPEYLDRDVLWLPQGEAGLQPLPGHRWAEPLREAVPRVLLHDLGRLLGPGRVWRGTPPPGLTVTRQLRVEILDFSAAADHRSVRLRARCALSDPAGQQPTQLREFTVDAPSGSAPGQLAAAHRAALFDLAQKVVTGM